MIARIATLKIPPMPFLLKFVDIRSYIFTTTFILMSIMLPFVFHQFHLAGPTYLPMHVFVLLAGLLFGWRAGLIVGVFSPLASQALSGMPAPTVLPQTVVELSVYGIVAGLLREKSHLRVVWSLLGAMISGRLCSLLVTSLLFLVTGESNSPLGVESTPLLALWSVVKQGWPGIVIQVGSLPILVRLIESFTTRHRGSRHEQRYI
ncbi:ECF transporter S component [Chloroflexota bacterium]